MREMKFTRTIKTTLVHFEKVSLVNGEVKTYPMQTVMVGEVKELKVVKEHLEEKFGVIDSYLVKSIELNEQKYELSLEKFLEVATVVQPKAEETTAKEIEETVEQLPSDPIEV